MELTKEQINFLDYVCDGTWELNSDGEVDVDGWVDINDTSLTKIPVKFGSVYGTFDCSNNELTTLENCPNYTLNTFSCEGNNLTNYFKNIKEEDFPLWNKLHWGNKWWNGGILKEYPFLINIAKKYLKKTELKWILRNYPQTKIYLE